MKLQQFVIYDYYYGIFRMYNNRYEQTFYGIQRTGHRHLLKCAFFIKSIFGFLQD